MGIESLKGSGLIVIMSAVIYIGKKGMPLLRLG